MNLEDIADFFKKMVWTIEDYYRLTSKKKIIGFFISIFASLILYHLMPGFMQIIVDVGTLWAVVMLSFKDSQ